MYRAKTSPKLPAALVDRVCSLVPLLWRCERCGYDGVAAVNQYADLQTVADSLVSEHLATQPVCGQGGSRPDIVLYLNRRKKLES